MRNHLLYFGRMMPFKDNTGEMHNESFWHLQDFSINTSNRTLYVYFAGYVSIEAFESGEESLIKKGGSWQKSFTGEAYDKLILFFAQAVAGVAQATWNIANSVQDTPSADGIFSSFFSAASEILAPEEMAAIFKPEK